MSVARAVSQDGEARGLLGCGMLGRASCWAHGEGKKRRWRAGLALRFGPVGKEWAERVGLLGWFEMVWVFLTPLLSISISTPFNLLNSNSNLNSTLALKQIKQCTSMNATTRLNLEKKLITCERKLI